MAAANGEIIVGLDIGTTKICCVVGEVRDGKVDVIAMGKAPSNGLRKGIVVNIEATVESISRAVQEAETMAGVAISSVYVGIAGSHIKGFNSHGQIPVMGREIRREDIAAVVDSARAVPIPPDQEIIHVLPQEYTVDDQRGIQDPLGMTGVRLEVDVHIVTGAVTSVHNIIKCCNKANLEVCDVVLEPLASAAAVLTAEEMELGVGLLDIGGGTSDLAVFHENAIKHTFVLGLGGHNLSNDLAIGLRTPFREAVRLKEEYGTAVAGLVDKDQTIEVPSVGGRPPRRLSRRVMGEILEARIEEMLTIVNQELADSRYKEFVNTGMVLTGGTALLENLVELAEQIFDVPVRIGYPRDIGGVIDIVNSPQYATGVGLVLYGMKHHGSDKRPGRENGLWQRLSATVRGWFGRG